MSKDYYKILGVDKNASKEDIKRAYRRLAHLYHPDKQGGDEAKFKEINEAYQVLSNDQKRQQYDQFGTTFEGAGQAGGWDFSGQQGFNWEDIFSQFGGQQQQQGGQWNEFDFGDIFGDVFSRAGFSQRKPKGKDIVVDIEIELEEADKGVKKELNLKKLMVCPNCKGTGGEPGSPKQKCPECRGTGQIRQTKRTFFGIFSQVIVCPTCGGKGEIPEKECRVCKGKGRIQDVQTINVELPRGVNDGQTIRIPEQGEAAKKDGISGDLYIRVHIKPHKYFERQGDDIYYDAQINFTQAVLGDKIDVPTLDGEVKLKIPEGTDSGTIFKIKNRGMARINGYGRGDEFVRIKVKVPKKLSKAEKDLIEKLKEEGM